MQKHSLKKHNNELTPLSHAFNKYEQQASTYADTIQSLSSQITMLTQTITNQRTNPNTSPPFLTKPQERKHKAKDLSHLMERVHQLRGKKNLRYGKPRYKVSSRGMWNA